MEAFMKKSDLMWLELALAEDVHNRKHMEYIYVDGGSAYATNGHRMHVAPCKLGKGIYCRYELQRSLEINNTPPVETDVVVPDGFNPRKVMIKQGGTAFNPVSEMTASDLYVQNGFYGQLAPKDGNSIFQRIYVLEALFGMSTKGETILHIHTKDDGENFMYANDRERSFVVMGMRLDKGNDCEG